MCLLFCINCTGQRNVYESQINNLIKINTMPYYPELSGDSIFWNITKGKIDIVPYLINRINDTTKTNASVSNFGGVYTIGDICVRAIEEIIKDFPTIKLIEADENLLKEKAYGIYWGYVNDFKNRLEFQKRVRAWYEENKNNLVWQVDDKLYAVSDEENGEAKKRPAGGYYIVKKNP
jgi:hypothetical protein